MSSILTANNYKVMWRRVKDVVDIMITVLRTYSVSVSVKEFRQETHADSTLNRAMPQSVRKSN